LAQVEAQHEERRFHVVAPQHIAHERRDLGIGAIIERQP
jgi:hypothetical protein